MGGAARMQPRVTKETEHQHDRNGEMATLLGKGRRGRENGIRGKLASGWGLFYDLETGETLGRDAREAFNNLLALPRDSPSQRFQYEVKARAARLDAEAVALDSCYEEDITKRVRKLRVAHDLYGLADEYEWKAHTTPAVKERVTRLTKKFQAAVDCELSNADGKLFLSTFSSGSKSKDLEERERIEEVRRSINSPRTKRYMYQKLREKRVKMITHVIGASSATVAAGAIWWAAAY